MKVVFRVDASQSIGSGHIARCLSLALVLRQRGAKCSFIGRQLKGHRFKSVLDASFQQQTLPSPKELTIGSSTNRTSRVLSKRDALDTIQALNGERPAWLIVDHYGIDEEWERHLRPYADKVFVIDDLADRRHDCDLLLNQNFSLIGEERYLGLVPKRTRLLLGPRYALLRPEFTRHRHARSARPAGPLTALISFGGSDIDNLTSLVLDVLWHPEFNDILIYVAIGANNPHRFDLERQIEGRRNARAHFDPTNMAELMAVSDFSIGAGGTTTWERLCLGLPSIVIAAAQNQVPTCETLSDHNAINYLGFWTGIRAGKIKDAIRLTIATLREPIQKPETPLVDGLGADRVAKILFQEWT